LGLCARPVNDFIQLKPHLFKIVQWFKSITTNAYLKYLTKINAPAGTGKLWQRGYYEHIIRNEIELAKIREYIVNNPFLEHKDDHDLEDYL
jgi:REP element-mobilizing transposase RayT